MEGENLTELHMVNGLHPNLPWRYYPRSLRELKAALPDVSLKAFTATEIHHFETISGMSASDILDELIDAASGVPHRRREIYPDLRDGVLDLWTDVSNAGGSVGFVPPVTREDIRPELVKHMTGMAEGRTRLLVGHDEEGGGWPPPRSSPSTPTG
ncbi:Aminodeoxyfutalosine synthase [Streptomyces violaceorubidus]